MLNLYKKAVKKKNGLASLLNGEILSIKYHSIFDYPLNFTDLVRWTAFPSLDLEVLPDIKNRNGYYFLEGKEGSIYKRLLHKRISVKKLEIAKDASKILSFIPGVKMIAITGSLAMENSSGESDIDLMIVTKKGSLWTTRLFVYMVIHAFGLSSRRPNDLYQKDKLCLNMWLDESDLIWDKKDRNIYTAHEIAQIVPLVNKNNTYERFLYQNRWILKFWPNSVKIGNWKLEIGNSTTIPKFIEWVCYKVQFQYMMPKVTREVVEPTRALFHPQDWGKIVLKRLDS
ncbi:MAG TPA: hypothetical protein VFI61_04685 [Patescibacteria group bacterium]|nr:hypothetical protein [Patescibacteria group bacterium]